ncbi:MAG: AAA family ATPase [Bacteriovorax sp.]
MNKQIKIHIFGASGSGVTTLGKNLSEHFHIPFFDADDYYWKNTDPPFQEANPIEMRSSLLKSALSTHPSWVISGSLISWEDNFRDEFTLAIYLYAPKEERIRRIKIRENERFGNRIEISGDMYEAHKKFIEWAKQYDEGILNGRSRPRHEVWITTLKCPVVRIEGTMSKKETLDRALCSMP